MMTLYSEDEIQAFIVGVKKRSAATRQRVAQRHADALEDKRRARHLQAVAECQHSRTIRYKLHEQASEDGTYDGGTFLVTQCNDVCLRELEREEVS